MTEQTIVDETEKSVSKLSEVNPNQNIKALKEKGTMLVVGLVVIVIFFCMNKGSAKTDEKEKATQFSSYEKNNVLKDNLARIQKLKQQSKPQAVTRAFSDGTPFVVKAKSSSPKETRLIKQPVVTPIKLTPSLSKEMLARMNAPTTFLNSGVKAPSMQSVSSVGENSAVALKGNNSTTEGANLKFINNQGTVATMTATKIAHPDLTVPAGELIPATMNVAQNSELPGVISAVTERDIYSLTGSNVLIPRGSKLFGRYNSGIIQGQSRFLVVWNRVQLANGVIVTLNSTGTDALGRSGLQADNIDRHFIERFSTATLLSILGAATANVGVDSNTQYNSAAQYRSAIAESLNKTASDTLQQDRQIKPTLHKYQGAEVNVFVAFDLDFSAVGTQEVHHTRLAQKEVWK